MKTQWIYCAYWDRLSRKALKTAIKIIWKGSEAMLPSCFSSWKPFLFGNLFMQWIVRQTWWKTKRFKLSIPFWPSFTLSISIVIVKIFFLLGGGLSPFVFRISWVQEIWSRSPLSVCMKVCVHRNSNLRWKSFLKRSVFLICYKNLIARINFCLRSAFYSLYLTESITI